MIVCRDLVDPARPKNFRDFNGSVLCAKQKRLVAFRRVGPLPHDQGVEFTSVYAAVVKDDCSLIDVKKIEFEYDNLLPAPLHQYEDPRLFEFREEPWLICGLYNVFHGRNLIHIRPLTGGKSFFPVIGGNVPPEPPLTLSRNVIQPGVYRFQSARSLSQNRRAEKNWMPYEHAGRLLAIYSAWPFAVYDLFSGEKIFFKEFPIPVAANHLHGSTPPLAISPGEMSCMVHWSVQDAKRQGLRLYRFAEIRFKKDFSAAWISKKVCCSDDFQRNPPDGFHSCIFPGSAELCGDSYKIAAGLHDAWLVEFDWPVSQDRDMKKIW